MPQKPHITIDTPEDYARLAKELQAKRTAIANQAMAEQWPWDRLIDETAAAILPYYTAATDPMNSVSTAIERQQRLDYLAAHDQPYTILGPQDRPDLQAAIAEETALFNRLHHTHYKPPVIVAVDHYRENNEGAVESFNLQGDFLTLDSHYLQTLTNPTTIRAMLGHELNHRYQRTPEMLLAVIREQLEEQWHRPIDARTASTLRASETESDYYAARLASPTAAEQFLLETFYSTGQVFYQYIAEKYETHTLQGAADFVAGKTPAERSALDQEFANLPPAKLIPLMNDAMQTIAGEENTDLHPSWLHRFAFQEWLKQNPEWLKRDGLHFDGSAHILEALNASPDAAGAKQASPVPAK